MKLLIDMNLSPRWIEVLADSGVEATHWSILGANNAPDSEIMAYARANDYVVLTHDLDFGAILAATHGEKPSVVQIRADDPGRFKLGFTTSLPERLRKLRCSAPLTKVVRTWPCKLLWEKTAIECVAEGCDRLHTEVFRTTSLDAVVDKCKRFFELMPKLPAHVAHTR